MEKKFELVDYINDEHRVYDESGKLYQWAIGVYNHCTERLENSLDTPQHIIKTATELYFEYKDDLNLLDSYESWMEEELAILQGQIDNDEDVNGLAECIYEVLDNLKDILFLEFAKTN